MFFMYVKMIISHKERKKDVLGIIGLKGVAELILSFKGG